jgi:gliding motility-associated-like protein
VLQNEAGCDSLLLDIELELLMTSVTVSNQQICSGEVTGTFDIESVEGLDFPIEVFIDGVLITTINNLPALGLTAPAGTSQLQLVGPICSIESNLDLVVDNGNTNINVVASNTEINTFALSIQSENTLADVVWTSDFQVDCLTSLCDEATITIDADTEISVSVLLENGCTVTDNSLLTAIEIVRDSSFVIYSANIIDVASQDNSVFYVQSNVELLVRELSVYDRWGNLVFNNENFLSNDASEGWDGRYNSTVVEQGVYIYRITYTDETNREQQIVSSITLVR